MKKFRGKQWITISTRYTASPEGEIENIMAEWLAAFPDKKEDEIIELEDTSHYDDVSFQLNLKRLETDEEYAKAKKDWEIKEERKLIAVQKRKETLALKKLKTDKNKQLEIEKDELELYKKLKSKYEEDYKSFGD